MDHYLPLVVAYLLCMAGWLLANRLFPWVWPRAAVEAISSSWKELGFALLGALGILVMGQFWSRGIRIPEQGSFRPILASINQMLIFSPILLVLVIRRQPLTSAWLPRARLAIRLLIGVVLASLALTAYSILREGAAAPWVLFGRIWRYENIDIMLQVFLEDLTIAILFVRLAGAIGARWATAIVPCLFAAGHIPAMISQGASWLELVGLLRDTGLGVAVILVVQRSRDIVWFWVIHFCLDMTQFARISGVE